MIQYTLNKRQSLHSLISLLNDCLYLSIIVLQLHSILPEGVRDYPQTTGNRI